MNIHMKLITAQHFELINEIKHGRGFNTSTKKFISQRQDNQESGSIESLVTKNKQLVTIKEENTSAEIKESTSY